jgi:hypothetical protein
MKMVGSSDFLQRHHDEILAAWANEAGRAASARGLSDTELRNLMPACLSALTGDADFAELMRHIQRHISDRIRWGFEIAEAVDEFAMLDRCIADRVRASPPDERPPADELARLFLTVQSIMVRTAETYEKHMRLDEQREKWFLRQLRTLADEALRATERPLAQPLKQMLAVIMEAMSAQCAALFLYDLRTELLVTRAAIGVAEEHLQEFTSSLDPATFAGRIAAHEEPTAVDDVATTELVVSDALRRSGIHSLLGVRLPPLHRIRGVMYVGIRERRSFSSRESRRIEALGEGLTLHLDNGRLHAELRERIGELEVERGLRERFVAFAASAFADGPPAPTLLVETEVPLTALTFGLLNDLDKLEPYGADNPRPRFLATGLTIDGQPRRIGGGERHLTFRVRQGGTAVRAVAFGMGDRLEELLSADGECSVVFTPKLNEWNGNRSVEMEVIDFRPEGVPALV